MDFKLRQCYIRWEPPPHSGGLAMNANVLNFLSTDGAVTVTFPKPLTPAQYSTLYAMMLNKDYSSSELCDALRSVASEWGIELVLDGC